MPPKKNKEKEIPPKKGLSNIRSWLQATIPPNQPLQIKDEPFAGSSIHSQPPDITDALMKALISQHRQDEQSPSSSDAITASQFRENMMNISPNQDLVTQELIMALANALQQQQKSKALQPQPITQSSPNPTGLRPQYMVESQTGLRPLGPGVMTRSQKSSYQNFQITEVAASSQKNIVPQQNIIKSKWIIKGIFKYILNVENTMFENDPYDYASKMFSKNFNFVPYDNLKTIDFYEKILSETKSVSFKHFTQNGTILYSTARIHKIINPVDWPSNPYHCLKIETNPLEAQPSYRTQYNYYDYKQAWWNAFYRSNQNRSHTWLIFFDRCSSKTIPHWFAHWWNEFGASPEIIHQNVLNGFNKFIKEYKPINNEQLFPKIMIFCLIFGISWVLAWFYEFRKDDNLNLLTLTRRYKIKWWDSFKSWNKVTEEMISKRINSGSIIPASSTTSMASLQTPFLHDKGFLISNLASASSTDQLKNMLEQALVKLNTNLDEEEDEDSIEDDESVHLSDP